MSKQQLLEFHNAVLLDNPRNSQASLHSLKIKIKRVFLVPLENDLSPIISLVN